MDKQVCFLECLTLGASEVAFSMLEMALTCLVPNASAADYTEVGWKLARICCRVTSVTSDAGG